MNSPAPRQTSRVRSLLRQLGVHFLRASHPSARYVDFPPQSIFDFVLLRAVSDLNSVNFVQIGANDGRMQDPLARYLDRLPWTGVMVEPLPAHFRNLQSTRGKHSNLKLVNAAVDLEPGRRTMFDLPEEVRTNLPPWASGLASFSRERVVAAAADLGVPPSAIVAYEVPTITWREVWETLGSPCDLLVLDTEGHDIPLLRAAGLGQIRPPIILFEHACATATEQALVYEELSTMGYDICTEGGDSVAYRFTHR